LQQAKELNEYREQIKQYEKKVKELTTRLEIYEPNATPQPQTTTTVSASVLMRSTVYDPPEIPELPPLEAPPEYDYLA
jgi:hypothetical protein